MQLTDGIRFSKLRRDDLPEVARALTAAERGFVRAERCYQRGVAYYRFYASTLDVLVLASDFERIIPALQNGLFDTTQYPVPHVTRAGGPAPDLSTIEQWDSVLYNRVLDVLKALFTESYPTSDL